MTLGPLVLGQPWGLLALLAVPAILVLHLLRRRFRPTPVTGLFLWGEATVSPASGRRKERLRRTPSLLLELLAALTVAFWLTDPHLEAHDSAHHLVVVLDTRARLAAVDSDGTSAQDRAREALATRLDALGRSDRVTLVLSGTPPQLLAGPAVSPDEARAALDAWRAGAPWHPLDEAVALALDLARGPADVPGAVPRGALLVATDHVPAGLPGEAGLEAHGVPRPASGLADVRWLAGSREQPERLVVRVAAFGGAPRTRTLVALAPDGREVARRALSLRPGEATHALVPLAAPGASSGLAGLTVNLEGDDPLAFDDIARLLPPPPRTVKVHLAPGAPGTGILRRLIDSVGGAVEGVERSQADAADLVIGGPDAWASAGAPGTWVLAVAPGDGPPVLGPYLAERGHPALADLDFTGCVWGGGLATAQLPEGSRALLAAGDRVMLTERRRGRDRDLTLHLDLARSLAHEHPALPGLFANLVTARREALPGPARVNLPLAQATTVGLPFGADTLEVTPPGGAPVLLTADAEGRAQLEGLVEPGTHRLRPIGPLVPADLAWAVQGLLLDPRLSDLTDARTETREPAAAERARVERRRGPLAHLLPLVLFAALALGAVVAHRREGAGATPHPAREAA